MVIVVLMAIFIAVIVPGYQSQIKTKFLSPVGSSSSKYCDDVTISNSGSFMATKDGSWEGSAAYQYSNATYTMTLVNVQMDQDTFAENMMITYNALVSIGEASKKQNLGVNLLYWMSWATVAPGYKSQRFYMTGNNYQYYNCLPS